MLPIRFRPIEMLLDLVEKGHYHAAQELVPIVRATIDEMILLEEEAVVEVDSLVDAMVASTKASMKEPNEENPEGELATEPQ